MPRQSADHADRAGRVNAASRSATRAPAVPTPIPVGSRTSVPPRSTTNRSPSPTQGLARMGSVASLSPSSPCARANTPAGQPAQRLQSFGNLSAPSSQKTSSAPTPAGQPAQRLQSVGNLSAPSSQKTSSAPTPAGQSAQRLQSFGNLSAPSSQKTSSAPTPAGQPAQRLQSFGNLSAPSSQKTSSAPTPAGQSAQRLQSFGNLSAPTSQKMSSAPSSQVGVCPPPISLTNKLNSQLSRTTSSVSTTGSQTDSAGPSPLSSVATSVAATSVAQPLRRSIDSSATFSSQGSGACSPILPSSHSQFSNMSQSPKSTAQAPSTTSLNTSTSMPTLLQYLHSDGKSMQKSSQKYLLREVTKEDRERATKAKSIFDVIDIERRNSICKLDLLKAVENSMEVRSFVLADDATDELEYECIFEEAGLIFSKIANGKKSVDKNTFARFFQDRPRGDDAGCSGADGMDMAAKDAHGHSHRLQDTFARIDANGDGVASKLDLLCAVQGDPTVASIVFQGIPHERVTRNSFIFDAVEDLFEKMSSGKKRIEYCDFLKYLSSDNHVVPRVPMLLRARYDVQRRACRALLIAPGFGQTLNPRQCQLVEQSGFQIEWLNLPNPETPGFTLGPHLSTMKSALDRFQPNLVAGASKGGHYITALWSTGLWRGPTLLLNAHPSLRELPQNVPVVVAHGSNDDLYPTSRPDLERLISTGSANMCFLYTTGDSGMANGLYARKGDGHNMESLLHNDCLPRLMDATLSSLPEMYMMWSWRELLNQQRIQAEKWLGYSPEALRRFWVSSQHRGLDSQKIYEVPHGSEEFRMVATMFLSKPKLPAYYQGPTDMTWPNCIGITKIERIENGLQEGGSAQPYFESLQKSVEEQGIGFEPGLHTRWAFHGTSAIDSIVNNPMAAFQPLMSGTRLGSVWGSGTYFARDAKYVVDSNLCQPDETGSRKMLMCLLMTGMSCLGSPGHKGVLPYRRKPYRYNSSVDSLSSPEIFVMQHPGAAHPAYVVTFR